MVGFHLVELLDGEMYAIVFVYERMVIAEEKDEIRVRVTLRYGHTRIAPGAVVLLGYDMRFLADDNRVR